MAVVVVAEEVVIYTVKVGSAHSCHVHIGCNWAQESLVVVVPATAQVEDMLVMEDLLHLDLV